MARRLAVVDQLDDVADDGEVAARRVQRQRDVADRGRPGRQHVLLGAGQAKADDALRRKAGRGGGGQRGRRHRARPGEQHPVGIDTADARPRGSLFDAGQRQADVDQLESVSAGQSVEQRDRFAAGRQIEIKVDDRLAAQVRHTAFAVADEADLRRRLAEQVGHQRKGVREGAAVGGVGAAVAEHQHRDALFARALGECIRDAARQRHDDRRALGAAVFESFETSDAAAVVERRLAFFPNQLDAVDAAVAAVEQAQVIDHAGRRDHTGRPGDLAAGEDRDELLARGGCRRDGERRKQQRQHRGSQDVLAHHRLIAAAAPTSPPPCRPALARAPGPAAVYRRPCRCRSARSSAATPGWPGPG